MSGKYRDLISFKGKEIKCMKVEIKFKIFLMLSESLYDFTNYRFAYCKYNISNILFFFIIFFIVRMLLKIVSYLIAYLFTIFKVQFKIVCIVNFIVFFRLNDFYIPEKAFL